MSSNTAEPGETLSTGSIRAAVGRVRGTARSAARAILPGWPPLSGSCSTSSGGPGTSRCGTPILEFAELHERKSGAGIVARLFEISGGGTGEICLRPELTASIVRAYAEAAECPPLPAASACRARSSGSSRPSQAVTASSPRLASSCRGWGSGRRCRGHMAGRLVAAGARAGGCVDPDRSCRIDSGIAEPVGPAARGHLGWSNR